MRTLALALLAIAALVGTEDRTVIAFGSCNQVERPQPLWAVMAGQQPDLFIWAGDIVYNDTRDPDRMARRYARQAAQPDYARFAAKHRIVGVWDDHDYGANDAGAEFPAKAASQQALLDFLAVPADSPRRQRAGVYAVHDLGDGDRRVRVLLLDCRYHRERPGPEADILGDAQWRWLEDQLRDSPARVHLLVSGIQVLASEHPYESWARFPAARARLLVLLRRLRVPGVVLLSGDRHIAECSRLPATEGIGYPLYDLTSSSLTHSWRAFPGEPNHLRLGPVVTENNYGLVSIDWPARQLRLAIGTADGQFPNERHIALDELRPTD